MMTSSAKRRASGSFKTRYAWGAIEVKLGSKEIEEAARNLLKLKEKIDLEKIKAPSFLMILTVKKLAYRREDGVFIVAIGCLKQ